MRENPSPAPDLNPPPAIMWEGSSGSDIQASPQEDPEAMEDDYASGPPHHPDHLDAIAPLAAGNQLTLSFQGEVFVFESVSPEKVQAVLLLLGGREMNAGSLGSSSLTPNMRLNFPHRIASLMRFREKRKERNFDKKIRYNVRKEVALRMQRSKGQFISSKSKPEDASLDGPDGTQQWGSTEDRPQAASECHHCGISSTSTPLMRKGPDGPRTLCNACGLMWANKGMLRDLSKNPSVPTHSLLPEPKLGGTIIDLSKNPSLPVHHT